MLKQFLSIVVSLSTDIHLRWMRRTQLTNLKLRDYFKTRYNVDVGLYSYGCFDFRRIPGPLTVGRYCSIAGSVQMVPQNHPIDALTTHPILYERAFGVVDEDMKPKTSLVIEDDVWIGHGAVILPGCLRIGRGAIIGAASVVTRDVAPYSVVAGNPARKLRDRFPPELVAALEASRWWELEVPQIRELVHQRPELVFHPNVAAIHDWISQRAG